MTRTRILIVHHSPAARAMLGRMFPSPEFEIAAAASERTAVRLLENPPRLVIHGVDPHAPDAWELLSFLHREHPTIPVILLVGSRPDRHHRAVSLGAVAVLKFPPPADLLQTIVAQALGGAG